jgi:hypothetical protein
MKICTIALLFCIFADAAMGQAKYQGHDKSLFLTEEKKLDSIVIELWDSAGNSWNRSVKNARIYDANGNVVSYREYHLDSDNGWVNYKKQDLSWDENNRHTSYVAANWNLDMNQWIEYFKVEKIYNENGDGVDIIYNKDMITNQWVFFEKDEYSYYINHKIAENLSYYWNPNDTLWDLKAKSNYTYNTRGEFILALYLTWQNESGQWINNGKGEDIYDTNDNLIQELYIQWNDLNVAFSDTIRRIENVFNVDNKLILSVTSLWDESLSRTVYSDKHEYWLDASGNCTSSVTSLWDNNLSQWLYSDSTEYTLDTNNQPSVDLMYLWDENQYEWRTYQRTKYYWSNENATGIKDEKETNNQFYPNPASDFVIFNIVDLSASANIKIFDLQGKMVLNQVLPDNKQVFINTLPKGIYIYRIQNHDKIFTGKITVD